MRTAIILGDAKCVNDDATAAFDLFKPDAVAACNCIGIDWQGPIDYWFTLHPRHAAPWPGMTVALDRRTEQGLNRPQTWAHKNDSGIDKSTPDWAGSTGLLAVKAMLEMGFTRLVLCGIPMEVNGCHYYSDTMPWNSAQSFQRGWLRRQREIAPYVRSMSGWTKGLLGEPYQGWLDSDD